MIRLMLLATALTLPGVAAAQSQSGTPPQRIRNVQLAAGQKCPDSTAEEVVVCSLEEDPYRIPKQFRNEGPIPSQNQSWVNRTATMNEVGRVASGLPDTCSAIGTGGQSGCALQANRAWAAEKRAQARAAESVPGGEP